MFTQRALIPWLFIRHPQGMHRRYVGVVTEESSWELGTDCLVVILNKRVTDIEGNFSVSRLVEKLVVVIRERSLGEFHNHHYTT